MQNKHKESEEARPTPQKFVSKCYALSTCRCPNKLACLLPFPSQKMSSCCSLPSRLEQQLHTFFGKGKEGDRLRSGSAVREKPETATHPTEMPCRSPAWPEALPHDPCAHLHRVGHLWSSGCDIVASFRREALTISPERRNRTPVCLHTP